MAAVKVFFSYSRKDEDLRDELAKHLSILKRQGVISEWYDRQISAGTEWAGEIDSHLNSAQVILLLISADFLASDYCYDIEMRRALERHGAGLARVIPVILRPVDWRDAPFGKLQTLPRNGEPVTSRRWSSLDEAFLTVAQGIRESIRDLPPPPTDSVPRTISPASGDLTAPPQLTTHSSPQRFWTRREVIVFASLGGTGLLAALGLRAMQSQLSSVPTLSSRPVKPLKETEPFDVIATDAQGFERRDRRTAQFFDQSLGNKQSLRMMAIPGMKFFMGAPETEAGQIDGRSRPQHWVTVPDFFISNYSIDQAIWQTIASRPKVNRNLDPNPSVHKGAELPVEYVSWLDACEFCDRLSQLAKPSGLIYRLPTEAEWEYACRAGTTTPFHFGEVLTPKLANFCVLDAPNDAHPTCKSRNPTTDVDNFPPNAFGLHQMHGNVWEWCLDHWHDTYEGAPTDGSAWLTSNELSDRVLRGGSCGNTPSACRSAHRVHNKIDYRDRDAGFRVVCTLPLR